MIEIFKQTVRTSKTVSLYRSNYYTESSRGRRLGLFDDVEDDISQVKETLRTMNNANLGMIKSVAYQFSMVQDTINGLNFILQESDMYSKGVLMQEFSRKMFISTALGLGSEPIVTILSFRSHYDVGYSSCNGLVSSGGFVDNDVTVYCTPMSDMSKVHTLTDLSDQGCVTITKRYLVPIRHVFKYTCQVLPASGERNHPTSSTLLKETLAEKYMSFAPDYFDDSFQVILSDYANIPDETYPNPDNGEHFVNEHFENHVLLQDYIAGHPRLPVNYRNYQTGPRDHVYIGTVFNYPFKGVSKVLNKLKTVDFKVYGGRSKITNVCSTNLETVVYDSGLFEVVSSGNQCPITGNVEDGIVLSTPFCSLQSDGGIGSWICNRETSDSFVNHKAYDVTTLPELLTTLNPVSKFELDTFRILESSTGIYRGFTVERLGLIRTSEMLVFYYPLVIPSCISSMYGSPKALIVDGDFVIPVFSGDIFDYKSDYPSVEKQFTITDDFMTQLYRQSVSYDRVKGVFTTTVNCGCTCNDLDVCKSKCGFEIMDDGELYNVQNITYKNYDFDQVAAMVNVDFRIKEVMTSNLLLKKTVDVKINEITAKMYDMHLELDMSIVGGLASVLVNATRLLEHGIEDMGEKVAITVEKAVKGLENFIPNMNLSFMLQIIITVFIFGLSIMLVLQCTPILLRSIAKSVSGCKRKKPDIKDLPPEVQMVVNPTVKKDVVLDIVRNRGVSVYHEVISIYKRGDRDLVKSKMPDIKHIMDKWLDKKYDFLIVSCCNPSVLNVDNLRNVTKNILQFCEILKTVSVGKAIPVKAKFLLIEIFNAKKFNVEIPDCFEFYENKQDDFLIHSVFLYTGVEDTKLAMLKSK